jgi:hypothetical protein
MDKKCVASCIYAKYSKYSRKNIDEGKKSSCICRLKSKKCGGGSLRPDKHKMNGLRRRFFAFLDHLAYDLEGLAAGAGQIEMRRRLAQRRQA